MLRLLSALVILPTLAFGQTGPQFHDGHFHPTDYIQQEIAPQALLDVLGETVGRVALMGIPLQQKWDPFVSGDRAPNYYLNTNADLYYYSFVDAALAELVRALPVAERDRVDPMITGFNPTDMYAVDHVRRVLRLYPGVFTGIGEFSIHKEVVSSKTVGHTASLRNPALDRILEFAAETGLLVMLHSDADVILPRPGDRPAHFDPLVEVLREHPGATVLWAHAGLGRFVEPTPGYAGLIRELLEDPALERLHFDLSWDVVAEQVVAPDERLAAWADLLDRWPDRFVLGSDTVVPATQEGYLANFEAWQPLLDRVSSATGHAVRLGNYERLFDGARDRVRAWEREDSGRSAPGS